MKATQKNTANGLVVSNESPIFALPKHLFVGHIKSYKARLGVFLLHFCSYGGGALASIGGTPSFYTANCVQLCQSTTQSASARSTVQLRPVATTALWRIAKSFGHILTIPTSFGWKFLANEKFADSKTLCTFAVRSFRAVKHIQCLCAYGRTSLSYLHCSTGTSQFSGVRPSFVHIANSLCYRSCEVPTQSIWRSIVTRLHLVMSIASSRIGRYCDSISKNPTSFGWKFTVIRRRLFIAMLRLSRPARRYWRLVQQSSSSSDAVLPSASTTSLSAAASSPNLKSFAL